MLFRKSKVKMPGIYQLYGPVLYRETDVGLDTTTTPEDNIQASVVLEHVKAWCIRNGFFSSQNVAAVSGPDYEPVVRIHNLNFRTLVKAEELDRLIAFLKDTENDYTTNRILALHTSLLTIGDVGYLTKLVNKLYHGLTLTSPPGGDHTWPEIHRAFPYLWTIWLIQLIVHQHSPPNIRF